ncbi:hypothetical protein EV401DRAFT_2066982 [Pisolithus croceorrhizus]|nr:hypothetical protein EV401DRAFT_2066982 [Pisolithus croceorrhizus]
MSASLSIDSGTATTATLAAPPAPHYNIPFVVLFDVQNLVSGNHSATMTVLDWDGGFSGMMLDYIDVNEAVVAGTTSTTHAASQSPTAATTQGSSSPSATPSAASQSSQSTATTSNQTSSSTATSPVIASSLINSTSTSAGIGATSSSSSGGSTLSTSSSSKLNVGAIAGGAVAGAFGLLALCVLAVILFRRRRSRSSVDNTAPLLHPESRFLAGPHVDPFARAPTAPGDGFSSAGELSRASIRGVDATTTLNVSAAQSSSLPASTSTSLSPQEGDAMQGSAPDTNSTPTRVSVVPLRQLPTIPISPSPSTRATENAQSSSQGGSRETSQAGGVVPNSQSARQPILTDEQADFVTSLYQNNVPAPVVARVLERMLANPNPSPTGSNPSAAVGPHDPELRAYMPMQASGHRRILSWLGSQLGDAESTAPPSYDHAQTHS